MPSLKGNKWAVKRGLLEDDSCKLAMFYQWLESGVWEWQWNLKPIDSNIYLFFDKAISHQHHGFFTFTIIAQLSIDNSWYNTISFIRVPCTVWGWWNVSCWCMPYFVFNRGLTPHSVGGVIFFVVKQFYFNWWQDTFTDWKILLSNVTNAAMVQSQHVAVLRRTLPCLNRVWDGYICFVAVNIILKKTQNNISWCACINASWKENI